MEKEEKSTIGGISTCREEFVIVGAATGGRRTECIKADKKLFWQGAVQEKLGAAAAKGKKVASAP